MNPTTPYLSSSKLNLFFLHGASLQGMSVKFRDHLHLSNGTRLFKLALSKTFIANKSFICSTPQCCPDRKGPVQAYVGKVHSKASSTKLLHSSMVVVRLWLYMLHVVASLSLPNVCADNKDSWGS